MELSQVIVPLLTHFIPILFFLYMGLDVLLRNARRSEHVLLASIAFCFMLLFTEEYVRHQLPIQYSPSLAAMWFSSIGIMIPGLGFHLLIKFARIEHMMPRFLYPYIFYLPAILVLVNLLSGEKVISSHAFVQTALWKVPVYNEPYYIAMACSIVNNLLYLLPLVKGKAIAAIDEHKKILNLIIFGVILSACWFAVFGLLHFGGNLPPYPYLYGGALWCLVLRRAMNKYDFLNFVDNRYQKLFNMNASAILLADLRGSVKEANPGALELFGAANLAGKPYFDLLNPDICVRLERRQQMRRCETILRVNGRDVYVVMDCDYVLIEYEPHAILMIRDVTTEMERRKEITFLAYHDPLTRLPNRRSFYEQLEKELLEARDNGSRIAVVLIDLDCFKELNDRHGHSAGDDLLVQAGAVMTGLVGSNGMAARLGGDEFVLFLRRVPSRQSIDAFMDTLRFEFQRYVSSQRLEVPVGMSLGASCFPDNDDNVDSLIGSADKEMYLNKQGTKLNRITRQGSNEEP